MVTTETELRNDVHLSPLDRLSSNQLRWAGAAAALIGLVAASNPSELWRTMDAHAAVSAPVPAMERVDSLPVRPWQPF